MALAPKRNFFALLEDGIGDDSLEFIHRGASKAVYKEQQQEEKAEPSQELSPESLLQDDALIPAHDHVDDSSLSQNSSVIDVDWQLVVHKHRKQGTRSQLKELNGAAEISPVQGVQKQDHPRDLVDNMKQQEVIDSDNKCEATEQKKQTPDCVPEDEKAIVGVQQELNGATEVSPVQGVQKQDNPYYLVDNLEQEKVVNNDSKCEATEQEKQTLDHVLEDEEAIVEGVQKDLNDATEISRVQGVQKQDHPYDLVDNMEQQEVVNNDSKCEATEQEKQTLDHVLEDEKSIVEGVQKELNSTTEISPIQGVQKQEHLDISTVQGVQKQDHPYGFVDIMELQEIIDNDGKCEATEQEKQTLDHVLEDEKLIVEGVQKELNGATEISSVQGNQKQDHPHDLVDNMEQHEVVDNGSRCESNKQEESSETLDEVLEDKKVIVEKKKKRNKNKKNKTRKKMAFEERPTHIHDSSLKECWMFPIIILLGIMLLGVLPWKIIRP